MEIRQKREIGSQLANSYKEFDFGERNLMQLIFEDMPRLQVNGGVSSSQPNETTRAIATILDMLGFPNMEHQMQNGIFDWSMQGQANFNPIRGAVNAVMGKFHNNSATTPEFWSKLQDLVSLKSALSTEKWEEIGEQLANNAMYFTNSLNQGQHNHNEAKRRARELQEALERAERLARVNRNREWLTGLVNPSSEATPAEFRVAPTRMTVGQRMVYERL